MTVPEILEYERGFIRWAGDKPSTLFQVWQWIKDTEEGEKFIKELYEELEKNNDF